MTVTVLPPSPRNDRSVLSALPAPAVRAEGSRTVVVLRGEADFSARAILSDALSRVIALHAGDVVIDLADAEFIDIAAVRVCVVAQQLLDGPAAS